ncbi:MAG TPA: primosomal protein N' [Pirellulales bacterium]|nr:primosomal protein N' [Pirellulales bacterium]
MTKPEQHRLFDEPAPWEADEAEQVLVATVVFPTGAPREYDYAVPAALAEAVQIGRRVRVPLGRSDRAAIAWCVGVEFRSSGGRRLKEVREVVDTRGLLSPAMLRLSRWMADYYLCEWGQVLEAIVPASVRDQSGTRLMTLLAVPTKVAARLAELKLPKKQLQILRALAASPEPLTPTQLAHLAHSTTGPITTLRRKGLIEAHTERLRYLEPVEAPIAAEADHTLNADQQRALTAIREALDSGLHSTVLLHGITGSGKTEVYIQAIQHVVSFGRQAIVLVPEISLTPQTRQRFRARFGRVAVLHSHLSDAERHWHWERIARGEIDVVVGARSAIFAPVPQLGLIVLDEEHESSFKQATAPRYHARDVALRRAADERVPLVLGSATPSLETWQRACQGEYRLVELPGRALERPLPDVLTVDLRHDTAPAGRAGAISRQLLMAMQGALNEGGQVILLLNRRGFSTHIQCPACGEVVRCPHCAIALTHHRHARVALCHYCDYEMPPPMECPACHAPGILYRGLGTQRLEDEVRVRFPDHACLRMDTDTMQEHGSHERALAAFREGQVKILMGTQMIAKGLDFPNVTLVGVINADTALHLPDFRAAERTFQLIVQVAGRTGRGDRGGRVIVQTFNPDHPAVRAAVRHDYAAFAEHELPIRESLGYPPFGAMARLVVRGPVEAVANQFAEHLAERLRQALAASEVDARLLGPAPAPIAKLRGKYRFQLQLQSADAGRLHQALVEATTGLKPPDHVQWIVDIDPLEML